MTRSPLAAGRAGLIIAALAVISALGSLAIHMLVPALPGLAQDLGLSQARAQLAISVYLVGLGGGQLLAGPLADRAGRRPVLLAGLVCYIIGAVGSTLAPGLPALLGARLVQALGGAAGVVTARVMVSDIFGREESARRQATLMMIVLVSPALAPVAGGLIAGVGGWRAIPATLAVVGISVLAVAALRLPETGRPARHSVRSPARGDVPRDPSGSGLARLLRNPRFVLPALTLIGGSSTLYMFLASAAFLLVRRFGLTELQAGPCFLAVAAASIVGTRLVGLLGRRCDLLLTGSALILAGPLIELALALAGFNHPAALIAPMLLLGLGAGIVGPAAIALVAFAEEGLAGTATSLAGAGQMLASAAATALLGHSGPIDLLRLGIALSLSASLAFAAALIHAKGHCFLQGLASPVGNS